MAFARNGGGSAREATTLKDKRAALTPDQRKVVGAVTRQFEADLIDALPELNEGCQTTARSGSFTTTLQVKGGKKDRFRAELVPRVRTPREKTEFDMHMSADGQLSLGLPPGWTDDDDDDQGSGGEGGESGEGEGED